MISWAGAERKAARLLKGNLDIGDVYGELEADQCARIPLRCQRIAAALGALPAFRRPNTW